jgi:hypothetical protein
MSAIGCRGNPLHVAIFGSSTLPCTPPPHHGGGPTHLQALTNSSAARPTEIPPPLLPFRVIIRSSPIHHFVLLSAAPPFTVSFTQLYDLHFANLPMIISELERQMATMRAQMREVREWTKQQHNRAEQAD